MKRSLSLQVEHLQGDMHLHVRRRYDDGYWYQTMTFSKREVLTLVNTLIDLEAGREPESDIVVYYEETDRGREALIEMFKSSQLVVPDFGLRPLAVFLCEELGQAGFLPMIKGNLVNHMDYQRNNHGEAVISGL